MMSTKITILPNGSARIEGEFTIVYSEGKEFGLAGRTTVSLCRCGLSKNKPFCDGAHKENFDAETKAFDLPPKKV